MGKSRVHFLEYSSGKTAYHTDHLGSSNVITDQDGNLQSRFEYLPYGKTSVDERPSNPESRSGDYRFTGKELDATGLYYYGARYYDPELGRFITADSIVPAPFNPQTLNRYSYCENNPINYTDPTGHWSWKKFFRSVFSGFIGGLVFAFTGNPMLAGMAAGAVHGGLTGGISGAIRGAAFGGLMGAGMGVGAQLFGPSFAIAALGASAAYTGATQGWEGLGYMAGGIFGGVAGYQLGTSIGQNNVVFSDAAKNQRVSNSKPDINRGIKDLEKGGWGRGSIKGRKVVNIIKSKNEQGKISVGDIGPRAEYDPLTGEITLNQNLSQQMAPGRLAHEGVHALQHAEGRLQRVLSIERETWDVAPIVDREMGLPGSFLTDAELADLYPELKDDLNK